MKLLNVFGCVLASFTAVQALDIPLPDALKMVYGLPECAVSWLPDAHPEEIFPNG